VVDDHDLLNEFPRMCDAEMSAWAMALFEARFKLRQGPEGRKSLAQGASPGSRKPSDARQPQRGERKALDGELFVAMPPLRGLIVAWERGPRARALG